MAIGVSLFCSQVFDVFRSRNAGTWLNAFIVSSHYSTGFFEIQVFSCQQFGAVSVFVNCVNSSFRETNNLPTRQKYIYTFSPLQIRPVPEGGGFGEGPGVGLIEPEAIRSSFRFRKQIPCQASIFPSMIAILSRLIAKEYL
jgi:hypothetical protein